MKRLILFFALYSVPILAVGQVVKDHNLSPARQFDAGIFLEGIVFDENGFGYVSATRDGVIYRFRPDQEPIEWARSGAPNGHKILDDGTHVVADRAEHAIVRFDNNGQRLGDPITESQGFKVQAPNDITLDHKGGFYFSDMRDSFRGEPNGTIHYVNSDSAVVTVAEGLSAPNGLVVTPDGQQLLVAESRTNHIIQYQISEDGSLAYDGILADLSFIGDVSDRILLDGMTIDDAGTVYVATVRDGGIYSFSAAQTDSMSRFSTGLDLVTNLAFLPGEDILYVVGSNADISKGSVFSLDLKEIEN